MEIAFAALFVVPATMKLGFILASCRRRHRDRVVARRFEGQSFCPGRTALDRRFHSGSLDSFLILTRERDATAFDDRHVGVHNHVLGARQTLDCGASGIVVEVRMADQKNVNLAEMESQLLDASADRRRGTLQV